MDTDTPAPQRIKELRDIQDATLLAVSMLAARRDSDTGSHTRRIPLYIQAAARELRKHPRFAAELTDDMIDLMFRTAAFHDLGTIAVPDRILLKPGKYEADEFAIMKTHTTMGRDALVRAENALGIQSAFLDVAKAVTYAHHERWDGNGYPLGLRGDDIPMAARLLAIADVYDARVSPRTYRVGLDHSVAMALIVKDKGAHFDADMVDAFVAVEGEIEAVAKRHVEPDSDIADKIDFMVSALGDRT